MSLLRCFAVFVALAGVGHALLRVLPYRPGKSVVDVLCNRSESGLRSLRWPRALVYRGSSMPSGRGCKASLCNMFVTIACYFFVVCVCYATFVLQMKYCHNNWTYRESAAADRLALFYPGLSSVTISGTTITARLPATTFIPRLGLPGNRPPRLRC